MNGTSLFLAECLCLSEALGGLWALLVAELDKCLLHHVTHGQVPRLLIHQVGVGDILQEIWAALPRNHLMVLIVNLLSEGLPAGVGLASRALPITIVYLVPIVNLREWEAWRVAILINQFDFVLIECINKGVLPWANFINIRSVHHYLGDLIACPFRNAVIIARWASTINTAAFSLVIRPAPVHALGRAHAIKCCGIVWGSILEAAL